MHKQPFFWPIMYLLASLFSPLLSATANTPRSSLSGIIQCRQTGEAISFATVLLMEAADSGMVNGTITDMEGRFFIGDATARQGAFVKVSHISYRTALVGVDTLQNHMDVNILLDPQLVEMEAVVVTGQRLVARAGNGKVTYMVSRKMTDASFSATDLVKHIPGVTADLTQNLSLDGKTGITILVNGIERDAQALLQLDAGQVDRIEVIHTPGAGFRAETTGVIHVILREREQGISGYLNTELPIRKSAVFIFPHYGLSASLGKWTLHTGYQGEVSRLDRVDKTTRVFQSTDGPMNTSSAMALRQDHWSHRFHAGADWRPDSRHELNFHAYVNPYSRENDGLADFRRSDPSGEEVRLWAQKDDSDRHLLAMASLFARRRHASGRVWTADIGVHHLKGETTHEYVPAHPSQETPDTFSATVSQRQLTAYGRADLEQPLPGNWQWKSGAHMHHKRGWDPREGDFSFSERVFAGYAQIDRQEERWDAGLGLRAEWSSTQLPGEPVVNHHALLPHLGIGFRPAANHQVRLSWRRSLRRPSIRQLHPGPGLEDPFSVQWGNPLLEPELQEEWTAGYSFRRNTGFFSARLFASTTKGVIHQISLPGEPPTTESRALNAGDIRTRGIRLGAALNLHPNLALNPSFNVCHTRSTPGTEAAGSGLQPLSGWFYEAGLSAILQIREGTTLSFSGQYTSPHADMQRTWFSDALYFISLDQAIGAAFKLGMTTAVPFRGSFTYNGMEYQGLGYHGRHEGTLRLPAFPVMIRLQYRFSRGKPVKALERERLEVEERPKIGF